MDTLSESLPSVSKKFIIFSQRFSRFISIDRNLRKNGWYKERGGGKRMTSGMTRKREKRKKWSIEILEHLSIAAVKRTIVTAGTIVASRSVSAKIPLRTRLTASRASSAGKLPKWQYRQAFRNRSIPRPQHARKDAFLRRILSYLLNI